MLQGFSPSDVDWRALGINECVAGHAIGKSLNVVMVLHHRPLHNSSLILTSDFDMMQAATGFDAGKADWTLWRALLPTVSASIVKHDKMLALICAMAHSGVH